MDAWSQIMRRMMMKRWSSHDDTEACCGNLDAPHRSHFGWAIRETPSALPVMSHFSPPLVDMCHPSLPHRTSRLESLQKAKTVKLLPTDFGDNIRMWVWYQSCLRLSGTALQMKLHPSSWAGPKARLVSQTPGGHGELWMGWSGDAWGETEKVSLNELLPYFN